MTVTAAELDEAATVARLAAAVRTAAPRAGHTRVIALDGPSGAGKTTLASLLCEELSAPFVTLEDLYGGWDGLTAGIERLVTHVLAPLAAGTQALRLHYDWHADRWDEPRPLVAGETLVVDGVGAGAAAARPYLSLLVWLDAPADVRRARALARDGATYAPYWDRWAAQETDLFTRERTWESADVVLHTLGPRYRWEER